MIGLPKKVEKEYLPDVNSQMEYEPLFRWRDGKPSSGVDVSTSDSGDKWLQNTRFRRGRHALSPVGA